MSFCSQPKQGKWKQWERWNWWRTKSAILQYEQAAAITVKQTLLPDEHNHASPCNEADQSKSISWYKWEREVLLSRPFIKRASPLACPFSWPWAARSSLLGSQILTRPWLAVSLSSTHCGVSKLLEDTASSVSIAGLASGDWSWTKRFQYQCRLKMFGTSSIGIPFVSGNRKKTKSVPATQNKPKKRNMPHCTPPLSGSALCNVQSCAEGLLSNQQRCSAQPTYMYIDETRTQGCFWHEERQRHAVPHQSDCKFALANKSNKL